MQTAQDRYNASEKGKEARRRYAQSERGRKARLKAQRAYLARGVMMGNCDTCRGKGVTLKRKTAPSLCAKCYMRERRALEV